MKILIVDQDGLASKMMASKLTESGHSVQEQPAKDKAVDMLAESNFDMVILDPTPLTSPRPLILNARRTVRNYPYILLASDSFTAEDAVKTGANDLIAKPLDGETLKKKIKNAQGLISMVRLYGDDSEDFPSAGGVIAKSAFNQLFLSAMDRADRYGEKTYILQIALHNYEEILSLDGTYAAEYAVAKLCQYMSHLRRQSDIIGQTRRNEYSLLLQRPIYETEPSEAANRFADELAKCTDIDASGRTDVEVRVSLISVPSGNIVAEHIFKIAALTHATNG